MLDQKGTWKPCDSALRSRGAPALIIQHSAGKEAKLASYLMKLCHFSPPPLKGEKGKMAKLRLKKHGFCLVAILASFASRPLLPPALTNARQKPSRRLTAALQALFIAQLGFVGGGCRLIWALPIFADHSRLLTIKMMELESAPRPILALVFRP